MPKENNITNSQDQDPVVNEQAEAQHHNIPGDNTIKDPDEWTTGDEPMTGAQRSYLKTLSAEAGVEPDENLTKAQASKRIEELQSITGRGVVNPDVPDQANTGEPE